MSANLQCGEIVVMSRNGSNGSQVYWLAVKLGTLGDRKQQCFENEWKGQRKCFFIIHSNMRAIKVQPPPLFFFFECPSTVEI